MSFNGPEINLPPLNPTRQMVRIDVGLVVQENFGGFEWDATDGLFMPASGLYKIDINATPGRGNLNNNTRANMETELRVDTGAGFNAIGGSNLYGLTVFGNGARHGTFGRTFIRRFEKGDRLHYFGHTEFPTSNTFFVSILSRGASLGVQYLGPK